MPETASAAYAQRRIDVVFKLANGSFDSAQAIAGGAQTGSSNNQLGAAGLRIHTEITKIPSPSAGDVAQTRIHGLTLDQINQLSYAGLLWNTRPQNEIELRAGDDESGMVLVHRGKILAAEPDFSQQPNVVFNVYSVGGYNLQMASVAPLSFKGGTSAASAMGQVIKPFGLTLENSGVDVQLSNPYLQGSPWTQVMRLLRAANVYGYLDMNKQVLAVWPKEGSRSSSGAIEFSPETGMIAYPTFSRNQVRARIRFAPKFATVTPGTNITIKSQLAAANGKWTPSRIDITLASETPGGPWELALSAASIGSGQGGG